jgi:hypothetical protein
MEWLRVVNWNCRYILQLNKLRTEGQMIVYSDHCILKYIKLGMYKQTVHSLSIPNLLQRQEQQIVTSTGVV